MILLTIPHDIFEKLVNIIFEDLLGPLSTKTMHFIELEKFLDLFVHFLILSNFFGTNFSNLANGRIGNEIEFLNDLGV